MPAADSRDSECGQVPVDHGARASKLLGDVLDGDGPPAVGVHLLIHLAG